MITMLRVATATVWIVFGVLFKVFNMVPRHRLIVASILGDTLAGPATILIGGAEALIGLWILSGIRPRVCAVVQTIAIATMNTLELTLARDLLLAPILMVCGNTAFLAAGWFCALKSPTERLVP
jgi:hypothetical protein